MLSDMNVRTSYVQVNIYGTNLNQLRQRGVNIKQLLSCLGYSKCIILDVPILPDEWDSFHNPDIITHLSESAEVVAPLCKFKQFSQSSILQDGIGEGLDDQFVFKQEPVSKSTLAGFASYGNIAISRCNTTLKTIKTRDSLNLDYEGSDHFNAHGCPRASTPCQGNDPDADRLINCTLSTICDPSTPSDNICCSQLSHIVHQIEIDPVVDTSTGACVEEFLDTNNVLNETLAAVPTIPVQDFHNVNNKKVSKVELQLDNTLHVFKADLPRCGSRTQIEGKMVAEIDVPSEENVSEKGVSHQNMTDGKCAEVSMQDDCDDDGSFYDCTSYLARDENDSNDDGATCSVKCLHQEYASKNTTVIPKLTTVKIRSTPVCSSLPLTPKFHRIVTEPLHHFGTISIINVQQFSKKVEINKSCPVLDTDISINPGSNKSLSDVINTNPSALPKNTSLVIEKPDVCNISKLTHKKLSCLKSLKSKRKELDPCVDSISLKALKSKRKKLDSRVECSSSHSSDVENVESAIILRPRTRHNRLNHVAFDEQNSFAKDKNGDKETSSQSNMSNSSYGSSDNERKTAKQRRRKRVKIPHKKEVVSESITSPSTLSTLKIFKCQMKGCPTKIQWRPRYGKNRLVDHVRLHWKKKMKKCKICDFAAPVFRMVSYHHSKVHGGQQFEGVHSMETPDDLRELLELWKECFPDFWFNDLDLKLCRSEVFKLM